jgi:plasmid stabilization system protein ParE
MAKVIWTEPAIQDLADVFDYLAHSTGSPEHAERICLDILEGSIDRLRTLPHSGSLVTELTEWQAREIYRQSYRIIYVCQSEVCYVRMCIHSSRDLVRHIDRAHWERLP